MSFEAREAFMNRIKLKLNERFFPKELEEILNSVADSLFGFDIDLKEDVTVTYDEEFLKIYINALRVQGRSEKTLDRYNYVITHMLNAIRMPTREISINHVRTFLSNEKARGLSESTLEGYRQIFSAFFGWLHKEGLIIRNPIANIGAIKVPKKIRKAYTDTEIEQLKRKARTPRDAAIVTFLFATGCRISEVIQLNIDDVNLMRHECKVVGKGNKERRVYLDEVAVLFLKEYLIKRNDDNPALFVGLKAPFERITPHGIRSMLAKLGKIADVEHVHPHKFRRTRATNLIKHGMPINEVADILGHDKIDTTMQYIAMDDSILRTDYNKFV